jgi:hypothetical protein
MTANNKYIRVAANVSDTYMLDDAKTVAFKTFQTQDVVIDFVNQPGNAGKLFQMIDLSTGRELVLPVHNTNNNGPLLQANVVAYVTRDVDGDPISDDRLYYTYIVTKNRGGYQSVQPDVVYTNTEEEQPIPIRDIGVVRQVRHYENNGVRKDVLEAFNEQNYSAGNQNVAGWISSDSESFQAFDNYTIASADSESRLWVWLDLGNVYTISKLKLWQHTVANTSRYIKDFRLFITNDANVMNNTVYYPVHNPNANVDYKNANGGLGRMPDEDQYTSIKFSRDLANEDLSWYVANASNSLAQLYAPLKLGGEEDATRYVTRNSTTGYHQFNFNTPVRERIGRYLYFEGQAFDRLPRVMQLELIGKKHT